MSLPPPSANQAFCNVSALQAGLVTVPLAWILDGVEDTVKITAPALCFLHDLAACLQSDGLVDIVAPRSNRANAIRTYVRVLRSGEC